MATGNFWDVSNPAKPVGLFDPDGVYDLSIDWSTWLTGLTDTYASHTITCDAGLECSSSAQSGGVITARIMKDPAVDLVLGQKYSITCHIVTASGQQEDQTLYLKIVEK